VRFRALRAMNEDVVAPGQGFALRRGDRDGRALRSPRTQTGPAL